MVDAFLLNLWLKLYHPYFFFRSFLLKYLPVVSYDFSMILLMKGTGTVVVNVDNENDHAPFCVQSTGIFSVSENAGMNNRLYDFVISHCNVLSNQSLA